MMTIYTNEAAAAATRKKHRIWYNFSLLHLVKCTEFLAAVCVVRVRLHRHPSAVASATVCVLCRTWKCTEWMPFGLILIKWKLHSPLSFNIRQREWHGGRNDAGFSHFTDKLVHWKQANQKKSYPPFPSKIEGFKQFMSILLALFVKARFLASQNYSYMMTQL